MTFCTACLLAVIGVCLAYILWLAGRTRELEAALDEKESR